MRVLNMIASIVTLSLAVLRNQLMHPELNELVLPSVSHMSQDLYNGLVSLIMAPLGHYMSVFMAVAPNENYGSYMGTTTTILVLTWTLELSRPLRESGLHLHNQPEPTVL